jgi:quercetin dioxygenase-like cupin family protein
MSSMHRTITGDVLVQHLGSDAMTIDQELLATHGRSSRTLVKEGPLRLTIIALVAGGTLPPHSTDNPVSIHLLHGDVTFFALDQQYTLAAGDVLILGPGVEHAARSRLGATFLLTVAYAASSGDAERTSRPPASDRALSEAAKQRWLDDGGHLPGVEPSRDRK